MSETADRASRPWQNWDVGNAAEVIDQYWLESTGEHSSRRALALDIGKAVGLGVPVFEVGCGTGLMAKELFDTGVTQPGDYAGGDVSRSMLAIARRRLPEVRLIDLDIFDLSPVEPQDNVICLHVVQHLPHYRDALTQLTRLARKQLYVATWFSASDTDDITMSRDSLAEPTFYTNHYGLTDFLRELRACSDRPIAHLAEWSIMGPTRAVHVRF